MNALALTVQHLGVSPCPQCLTPEQQLCPDPSLHLATAVCHGCEAVFEYRADHSEACATVAAARLAAACKSTWAAIDRKEMDLRVRTQETRKEQFRNVEDPVTQDFEEFSDMEDL